MNTNPEAAVADDPFADSAPSAESEVFTHTEEEAPVSDLPEDNVKVEAEAPPENLEEPQPVANVAIVSFRSYQPTIAGPVPLGAPKLVGMTTPEHADVTAQRIIENGEAMMVYLYASGNLTIHMGSFTTKRLVMETTL